MRLYDSRFSGNAWRVRLVLRHLGLPFERVTFNMPAGEHKQAPIMRHVPAPRVPVLELDDGQVLYESQAILLYLCEGTSLMPDDPVARSRATAWLFMEQADFFRPLALPRFFHMRGATHENRDAISYEQARGVPALDMLERWLDDRPFLMGTGLTVADWGVYPYIALAEEGGYELGTRPNIRAWTRRIEAQPGWEPLLAES